MPPAAPFDPRADLPTNDAIDLARRYGRIDEATQLTPAPKAPAALGSSRMFTVVRDIGDGVRQPEFVEVRATLAAVSEHAYFYAEDAIDADPGEVQQAADLFEESAWPAVTGIFGLPATPGIDDDPRIIVVQADLGGGVAGYVSADDGLARALRGRSNEGEIVYLDHTLRPGGQAYNSVLVHELQHLVHETNDPDEESWVNEGLSEAALIASGGMTSSIGRFEAQPETQLNDWPTTGTGPHYGASAAFFRFLAARLGGDQVLGEIARRQEDGPGGIDGYLAAAGRGERFLPLFADWLVANVAEAASGPFSGAVATASVQYEIGVGERASGRLTQFGSDYYALTGVYDGADYTLHVEGPPSVAVLPARDGDGAWWSNAGDGVDTTLTFDVDLGAGETSLSFVSWFDIERWFDYGYLSVSTDGGSTWEALPGEQTTVDDPVGVTVGPGRTGSSGQGGDPQWVVERADLARFAGGRVLVRFEYVTDGATHGRGWAVRDVRLGDEALTAAPSADGWVRLAGMIPQTYIVRLALTMADGSLRVVDVPMEGGAGSAGFSTLGVADATLVVAGATEGTTERPSYSVELTRN